MDEWLHGIVLPKTRQMTGVCSKCKIEKPVDLFFKRKDRPIGRISICKECSRNKGIDYRTNNRSRYLEVRRKSKTKNRHKDSEYYQKNKDRIKIRARKYREKNRGLLNERDRVRRLCNTNRKIKSNIHRRMCSAVKNKGHAAIDLIGCSPQELRTHLESKFSPGMSWDNYGREGWHIDHIRPCASFDLSDPEQQKQCFHYTNLQPLWAKENLSKGGRAA